MEELNSDSFNIYTKATSKYHSPARTKKTANKDRESYNKRFYSRSTNLTSFMTY